MSRRPGRNSLFLLFILVFFTSHAALAAEEVVYKDVRSPKNIFKDDGPSKKIDRKETGELEGMKDEKTEVTYSYDPTGLTDPFKSFIAEQEEITEKKRRKPRTYLETLDLSQLELIAVILSSKGNWAMVRDSKGLGHVIKKGTPIGIHDGFVFEIKDRVVVIREKYKDFRGKERHRDVNKKLPSLK